MRIPYLSARWEHAERRADEASEHLAKAKREQAEVRRLAAEARKMREANGFAQAIRSAMGV